MADVIRLLIVEDDDAALKSWEARIESFNVEGNNWAIEPTYAKTRGEAEDLVLSRRFDAAVIDLRLKVQSKGSDHNDEGNAVADFLTRSDVAAIAIHTGQPGEAQTSPERPHVRVIEKGDGLDPAIDWIRENADIILQVQKAKQTIQGQMSALFHTSIWPRWKYWVEDAQNAAALYPAVARHLISHVHAGMLETTNGSVHVEEWYFVPPIRSRQISTGDMIVSDGTVEVVITPRCDLANSGKVDTIQLAICSDISQEWKALNDKPASKAKQSDIRNYQQHLKKPVFHFLPRMRKTDGSFAGPWFVRFDYIRSIKSTDASVEALKQQRFASLTSEFLPSLVERLGAYFSRIGTPDPSEQ